MTKIAVHQAEGGMAAVVNPFLDKAEKTLEAVRGLAFELFGKRGGAPGGDLEDWLQAEQELFFIPAAETTEDDQGFTMKIETPGFAAADMEVVVLSRAVIVEAKDAKRGETGVEVKSLYRRFDLGAPIDTRNVQATLENGQLVIEAPRALLHPIPVRAAAACLAAD